MKRVAAFAGLVAVAAAGFIWLGNSRSAEGPAGVGGHGNGHAADADAIPEGRPVAVKVGAAHNRPMRQILQVNGSLRSDDDVSIGARLPGKVVHVAVREGDPVKRGHVLVRLDDRELRAQLARARALKSSAQAKLTLARRQATWRDTTARSEHERAEAALQSARTRVAQAETAAKLIEVETRTRVQTAEAAVNQAQERLAIVKDVTRKQELRQAQLAVEQAEARLGQAKVDAENARQVMERRQSLYKQDAIAREQVDEAERQYRAMQTEAKVAEASVAVAQQKLELAGEGSRPEEVRIAEGQSAAAGRVLTQARSELQRVQVAQDEVAAARAAQEQAEADLRAMKAGLVQSRLSQDDIRGAQAALQQAQADIAVYSTQMEDLTVRAPVDGLVATRQVNVGETVTPTSRLMDLVALDTVYLEAQVPELEVSQLRSGAVGEVTVDALPGKTFRGTVREIIPVAERASKSFRVRVAILGGRGLPAGGYARARVQVAVRPSALVVAKDAVRTESGDHFVWRLIPKEGVEQPVAERRQVRVGLVDERGVEILDGLQPGDRVVTGDASAVVEGGPLEAAL